jgi:STE24 endopeptidase
MNEDRSSRYHRLKRRLEILGLLWSLLFLGGLLVTGLGALLRDAVVRLAGGRAGLAVVLCAGCLIVLHEVGALPIAFYSGYHLERRYGLSREPLAGWMRDQVKSLLLGLGLGAAAASVVYACLAWSPSWWWAPAGAIFAIVFAVLANVAPVVFLPLFYSVKPLTHEPLRRRLMTLAERAGARVLGAYEWGLGEKTSRANAALAGLGSSRRILVSDTMLREYSEEDIEVVLAHEMAHHVHGDIWKGLLLESALVVLAFFLAARVLEAAAGRLALSGPSDIAGMPLLVLAAGATSLVMRPVARAVSRHAERKADRFALELTRNPAAFISAMRRLGAQNLAEEHPSRLVQWLFYSHPPLRERIASAQAFKLSA